MAKNKAVKRMTKLLEKRDIRKAIDEFEIEFDPYLEFEEMDCLKLISCEKEALEFASKLDIKINKLNAYMDYLHECAKYPVYN